MKTRLIAFLTTGVMLTSSAAMPAVMAADKVVTDPVIGTVPDWVPQDFAEAMQFYNTHGKSYTADNVICLVRPILNNNEIKYEFDISGSMTTVNTPASSQPKVYELEIPEKPDPDDFEAVKAYEEYCESIGLYSHNYDFFEEYAASETKYAFEVELFQVLDGLGLTVTWYEKTGDERKATEEFSFENKDGTIAETDLYGWLPDCIPEFNEFLFENGRASVYENYVVYCADIDYSTGVSLDVKQSGKGAIKEFFESDCNAFELIPVAGGVSTSVKLYKATKDGTVDVKWSVGREWSDEPSYDWTDGKFEIKDNRKVITDLSPNRKGTTVFTLIDKDTGELIEIPDGAYAYILKETIQSPYTSEVFEVNANPCSVNYIDAYDINWRYSFHLGSSSGWYDSPEFEVTSQESDRVEVTCRLKWNPSGDVNEDGSFNIADVVLLQRWLLGMENMEIADWKAADYCRDNKLNVFDLCLMKRKMFAAASTEPVEPDTPVEFGAYFYPMSDGMQLYLGPDESYDTVASLPAETRLMELGYQSDTEYWVYTKYNNQYGWIKIYDKEKQKALVHYEMAAKKPVIYLYPEKETDVHIELELTESELSTTYPRYDNGWNVTAYPDGTLLNKADGTHHRYLFWDSVNCRTRFDFSKGFCVAGSDTESFLREKLTYMGLTEEEMNEFIVYWLPLMEHNKYNLIAFQSEAYTDSAKLNITPNPDSLCRIFMAYVPLENAVDIEPQQLETFERNGFTVVEWGGTCVRSV